MKMNDIEQTISTYFKHEKKIIAVYLFGSYVSNRQQIMSDIDIGLIVDFKALETIRRRQDQYVADLSRMFRKDIHLILLNDSNEALLAQVFKKGKCLAVSNGKKLALFKMRVFTRIADFGYYKHMMQSGFVKRLMKS
jgi:predicted nucleotidyltransferase